MTDKTKLAERILEFMQMERRPTGEEWAAFTEKAEQLAKQVLDDGWRPIETAPKDGQQILLYRTDIQFVGYFATGIMAWVHSAPGLPLMDPQPTQWQPLREPPTKPNEPGV